MDAPFGILFLKKAELYNRMIELDERAKDVKKYVDNKKNNSKLYSTWPVEKEILRWTYTGHKHLATPITIADFNPGKIGKLKDWLLCVNNEYDNDQYELQEYYHDIIYGNIKKIIDGNGTDQILHNIVSNGYAKYSDKENTDTASLINKEGLLLGEVIYRAGKSKYIKNSYWFFSGIMNSAGAWVLFGLVILTIIMALSTWIKDMFCQ